MIPQRHKDPANFILSPKKLNPHLVTCITDYITPALMDSIPALTFLFFAGSPQKRMMHARPLVLADIYCLLIPFFLLSRPQKKFTMRTIPLALTAIYFKNKFES